MSAGTPPKGALKGVPEFVTDNAFYPKKVTIHQGDEVSFKTAGFHNILLAPKKNVPQLFAIDPATPVGSVKDAAGADFWFKDQASVGINPTVAAPGGGKVFTGKQTISSGLPLGAQPKPMKVKFPKKGTYTVLCALHPGMKGTVVVKAKKAKIPTKKQDRGRVKAQAKAASKLAKKLAAGQGAPTGLTVRAGNDKQGIAALAFFPGTKTREGRPVGEVHGLGQDDRDAQRRVRAEGLRRAGPGGLVHRSERSRSAHRVPERAVRLPARGRRHQPRQRVREHRHARLGEGDARSPRARRSASPRPGRTRTTASSTAPR